MNIVICCAMQKEVDFVATAIAKRASKGFVSSNLSYCKVNNNYVYLVKTGIGKVSSTIALTEFLAKLSQPCVVVNFGLAGSLTDRFRVFDLVQCFQVAQWDLNQGYKQGYNQDREGRYFNLSIVDKSLLSLGTVVTGDSFVFSSEFIECHFPSADIVDMELAALEQVCARNKVKLYAVKLISDSVGTPNQSDSYDDSVSSFQNSEVQSLFLNYITSLIEQEENG